MTESTDIELLGYMAGESSSSARAEMARRLETEPGLKRRLEELERLAQTLRCISHPRFALGFVERVGARTWELADTAQLTRGPHFEEGFVDRVMHRLEPELKAEPVPTLRLEPDSSAALGWAFRRLAPLATAAVIALAVFNMQGAREAQTALEAILGLEPVTLETTYTIPTLPEPSGPGGS